MAVFVDRLFMIFPQNGIPIRVIFLHTFMENMNFIYGLLTKKVEITNINVYLGHWGKNMSELISVMIVDDEKMILEDLSTMIDWEAAGYQIIATAFNGKQALRKYRELHPQVIFTDIRMPFMDGIEMISEIRKTDEKVSIILLTAYEDFSYAKAAISLGITEYIIKSEITANSLSDLLLRLKNNIIKAGRRERYITDRMLEQFFLSEEMTENTDIEAILNRPEYIIMAEQDLPVSLSGENIPEEIIIHRSKFVEILTDEKADGWELEVITAIPGRKMVIALNPDEKNYSDRENKLLKTAHEFQRRLQKRTGFEFTLYIVRGKISLYEFKRFYDENKRIFLKKYLEGTGKIHILDCSQVQELEKERNTANTRNGISMEEVLKETDSQTRTRKLKEILDIAGNDGAEQFISAAQSGYIALKHAYRKVYNGKEKEFPQITTCWKNWLDAEKIILWLQEQMEVYHEYISREVKGYSRIVADAEEYIYRSFRNPDLSLNDVAAYVHLSPGYLSSEFKKETGVTLKSYLTDVRIDAAKKMMDEGKYKIYEICSAVGYNSSQYFSQAFYKKTGMFPTEYSRQGGRKNEN